VVSVRSAASSGELIVISGGEDLRSYVLSIDFWPNTVEEYTLAKIYPKRLEKYTLHSVPT